MDNELSDNTSSDDMSSEDNDDTSSEDNDNTSSDDIIIQDNLVYKFSVVFNT